jgi:hypothetical protein
MTRFLKAAALVLSGFVLCIVLLIGVRVHDFVRSASLSFGPFQGRIPSRQEAEIAQKLRNLVYERNVKEINDIITVAKGDIEVAIHGPGGFPMSSTPLAEIVITNRSRRDLTMFGSNLNRLTKPSYDYQGYLQDDYDLSFFSGPITQTYILSPGKSLSIPAFFRVNGVGRHKINLSVDFPRCEQLTADSSHFVFTVVGLEHYSFSIYDDKNVPNLK